MLDDPEPLSRAGFIARNVTRLRLENLNVVGHIGEPFLLDNAPVATGLGVAYHGLEVAQPGGGNDGE